jgi:acid phosphatase family membrane protein YuiD
VTRHEAMVLALAATIAAGLGWLSTMAIFRVFGIR